MMKIGTKRGRVRADFLERRRREFPNSKPRERKSNSK